MKKIAALWTVVLLLCAWGALAETVQTPYDALARLMNGKRFALTLRAEDAEGMEEALAPYGGALRCSLEQVKDVLVFRAESEGEASFSVKLDAAGYTVKGYLTEPVSFAGTWAEAAPTVDYTEEAGGRALIIRMTGPDHALVTITCTLTGTEAEDYALDYGVMLLNADGTIQNFFDTVSASGGASARESLICVGDYDLTVEGEGEETVTREDGSITLSRRDAYTVSLDYEEIGALTLVSELVISE